MSHWEKKNMKFSKLILASAIALSSSAFAMQAMDEDSLSSTTGQDGITVSITTPAGGIKAGIIVHDSDGFKAFNAAATPVLTTYGTAGSLLLGAGAGDTMFGVNTNGAPITLTIDSAYDSGTGAVLNVAVGIPTNTVISTGDIRVAKSDPTSATKFDAGTQSAKLLDSMDITLGATTVNMQLGNAPQGAMIIFNTSMTGGLSLSNFKLNDAVGGGSIGATSISLKDTGGSDLTVKAAISAKPAGLEVKLNQMGDATNGLSVAVTGFKLGSTAPAIGNIDIIGLNLNGTVISVAGHGAP